MSVSSAYFDDEDPEIAISGFKLSAFNETGFSVDIEFANPAFITQSLTEQDTLEITFKAANLFSDKIDYEKLDPGTSLQVKLPSIMSQGEFAALVELKEQVEGPMSIFSTIQLVGNVFLAYGLKYLWNMVNLL